MKLVDSHDNGFNRLPVNTPLLRQGTGKTTLYIQWGAVITRPIFSGVLQNAPHSSPARAMYGMSCASTNFHLRPVSVLYVTVLLYKISCYIGSCCNGTRPGIWHAIQIFADQKWGLYKRSPLYWRHFNTLRPRRNGRHLADDIFKCIFLNENVWIPIKISLKFVPKGPINYIPALVQIMAWRRPGDKPLSELMMVRLPTHICVTRPQWVKCIFKMRNVIF